MKSEKIKISVIIPTRNGGERFVQVLNALNLQCIVPEEILVIDSGSTDATLAIAGQYGARVLSIPPQEFDHGGTRSKAAELAVGDLLVFMTQDAIPADAKALRNLIAPLEDSMVAAAYGRQEPFPEATCFARHLRKYNYPGNSALRCWEDRKQYGFRTAFISNSFAAYRKDLLASVGYFEDGLLFGEDTFTLAKLLHKGYCAAYAADARVLHSHNYSLLQEFRRYFDIGVVHARHRSFMESFGTPTGEGKKYVASELAFLVREKYFFMLPASIARNTMKLIAYTLGKHYRLLPFRLAVMCSFNKNWWMANFRRGA